MDTHFTGAAKFGYKAPIRIGERVEIAARCAFYSFDHGIVAGQPIPGQPLTSKGEISSKTKRGWVMA